MSSYQLLTLFLIPWIVFDGALSINRGGSGYYVVKESQEGNEENFVVMKERSLRDSAPTGTYSANWTSLDSRPLPSWYDDAKFGIFIHWGVFSVPSFGSEWFWYNWKENASAKYEQFMKANYPPGFTYQDFAPQFTAEFFDPVNWSKILKASGARYVVLTSKHHEGFTLWPSKHSFSWNSVDTGPHRDLVGDLAAAVRSNTDLKFGLYHSMYEWYNPLYLYDKRNDWKSDLFVKQKTIPELHELVETYKPEVIWSDGDWEAQDAYWTSKEFLAWLYNESPVKDTVVVNDRWGSGIPCKHGDFITCSDRYNPGVLVNKKWENCMTIDRLSWGFRREAPLSDYLTLQRLVRELVVTVSCGGNLLLNVGPTKDGTISPIFEERLREIGNWLHVNGQAIYATKPWKVQNDTLDGNVWYTQSKDDKLIFAAFLQWPKSNTLELGAPLDLTPVSKISFLSYPEHLDTKWEKKNNRVSINLPVEAHKGYPAWVLQIDRTG